MGARNPSRRRRRGADEARHAAIGPDRLRVGVQGAAEAAAVVGQAWCGGRALVRDRRSGHEKLSAGSVRSPVHRGPGHGRSARETDGACIVARIIYLHLGLPKTGTTTIQSVLFAERERLSGLGMLYPGFAENHSGPLRSIFAPAPHRLAVNRLGGAGTPEAAAVNVARWSRELDLALGDPGWTSLVLSAESASYLPADRLLLLRERLMRHADGVIVPLCLRQPFDIRVSLIQENLKTGGTIDEAVRRLAVPGHYRRTVGRIRDAFGAGNLRLGVFEEMIAHPGGLTGAFAAMIGLGPGQLPEAIGTRKNQRMSQRACLVLDRLNREVPLTVEGGRNRRRSRHLDLLLRGLPGPRFALRREQAEALRAAVEDDRAFADALLGRQVWKEGVPEITGRPGDARWVGAIAGAARLGGRFLP